MDKASYSYLSIVHCRLKPDNRRPGDWNRKQRRTDQGQCSINYLRWDTACDIYVDVGLTQLGVLNYVTINNQTDHRRGTTSLPNFKIRLKAKSDETKSQQIATQLTDAIRSGRIGAGDTLPSERFLSEELGVNRKTVRAAYEQLAQQGLVETLGTSGRRVRGAGTKQAAKGPAKAGKGAAKGAPAKKSAKKG